MTQQILIATQNQGKVNEYRRLFAEIDDLEFVGLQDIGLAKMDVEETGITFRENAILKAQTYAQASGMTTLSDDSGLEVDALDGRPGIYSARYGTPDLDDRGRRLKLLDELDEVADAKRTARFVCVIAIVDPMNNRVETVRGECEGQILQEERDKGHGFGYDAIFLPNGQTRTFAEIPSNMKNQQSHRAVAAKKALPVLQQWRTGRASQGK